MKRVSRFAEKATPTAEEMAMAKKKKNRVCAWLLSGRSKPIEKIVVGIHRLTETSANNRPSASTLKARLTFGSSSITSNSYRSPSSTPGASESNSPSLMTAATKMHDSRRFGQRPNRAIKSAATEDVRITQTGVNEWMVSMTLLGQCGGNCVDDNRVHQRVRGQAKRDQAKRHGDRGDEHA